MPHCQSTFTRANSERSTKAKACQPPGPTVRQTMIFASLEDFETALQNLPGANEAARAQARARQSQLTKPPGALGRLEDCAIFLAGWSRTAEPRVQHAKTLIFAGNHGVTASGVSPYPPEVTAQMVANFQAGGAAINAITSCFDVDLEVIPLDLEKPTCDISQAAALSPEELLEALNVGAAAVNTSLDVLALGEMGIGNTTIAAALAASTFGGDGAYWSGPGTGLDGAGVRLKATVVDRALARHSSAQTPAERLRCLGGRETAAIAGAIVAARRAGIPVVLDGYVVTAALAPLFAANPLIADHCIAGHRSAEPAHTHLLQKMNLEPLLDLGMRLGEGTGATLALAVLRAAAAAHNQMATFAEASVSNRATEN